MDRVMASLIRAEQIVLSGKKLTIAQLNTSSARLTDLSMLIKALWLDQSTRVALLIHLHLQLAALCTWMTDRVGVVFQNLKSAVGIDRPW